MKPSTPKERPNGNAGASAGGAGAAAPEPAPPSHLPRGDARRLDQVELRHLRLFERVGMINRIHAALRSTLNLEDIYSIILTTLISRQALDFSRAMLAGYDPARGVFHGLAALGATTREEHLRIQQEITEEERCLADMMRDLRNLEPAQDDETLFGQNLRELSSHSFWITTYQKFSANSELFERFRQVEIPCSTPPGQPAPGNKPAAGAAPACRFLESLLRGGARVVSRQELERSDLPRELIDLLPSESLWASIKTDRGMRLFFVVDKLFQDEPIVTTDQVHVEWFAGQVALALENAEMYKALELAYNDLRELDRMKSNFLSTISHELRTPLTAVTGYVQLMLGNRIGPLSAGQKEVLERILAHGEMLVGKVNDLIEIAELDSGRALDLELEAVDPLNVLMSVLPRVEGHRAKKDVTIEPRLEGGIPKIRANAEALERIFYHLLDNGVKFGHPGGHVWVTFEPRDHELHISVRDDGIGISRHQIETIFHAFYQVDSQLTRGYEGMGIGLAIIKKHLDLTHGRIQVQSEPGRGSTFTIIYPLAS